MSLATANARLPTSRQMPGCNGADRVKVRQAGRERKLGLPVYWEKRYEGSGSCVRAQSRKATGNPASKAPVGTYPVPNFLLESGVP